MDTLNRGLHQKGVTSPPSLEPHAQIRLRSHSHSRMSGIVCAVLLFSMAGTVSSSNDTNISVNGNNTLSLNKTNKAVWWEEFLTLHSGIAFVGGALLSTIFCCVIFFVIWPCSSTSGKQRKPKDQDTEKFALVAVTSVGQQRNGIGGDAEDEQTPLRVSRRDNGAADGGGAGGAGREVDYATIDYNHLKKREEAEEGDKSARTDYAEIRKERKAGDFSGGEAGGTAMADEEGEGERDAMVEEEAEREGGMEAEQSEDLGAVRQWHTGPEENNASLYSEIKEVKEKV